MNEILSRLREAKNDFVSWWKKRLQLLRSMANGMRSKITVAIAIKRAEISVACKRIAARVKSRFGFKIGND